MELNNTHRDQVTNLTKFIFGITHATAVNPEPCMPNWVGGNAANIRAAHRALTLGWCYIITEHLPNKVKQLGPVTGPDCGVQC